MNLFEVKTNFPHADFWLINKHSINEIGKPVKEFEPYLIGIKCNEQFIFPNYGFYACLHLYQKGIWRNYGNSCINLVRLRVSDVRNVLNNSFVI